MSQEVKAAVTPKLRDWTKADADKFMRMMAEIRRRQRLRTEEEVVQAVFRYFDALEE